MAKDLPVVAVLMSTYNGEKYIREQLDSIFYQQGVSVRLFVRDDGSTDKTLKILREYSCKYPIETFTDGENVRPGESFMRLVYQYADKPDIQYYAFADQDDIWLEDKLLTAVEAIQLKQWHGPVLYSSNQYIYIDGENKGNRHKTIQRTDLISHMTRNTIAGCTFVFNKQLAQLLKTAGEPDSRVIKCRLHDAWIMLISIVCGQVIYDEKAHMLYRIHDENTVGIRKISLIEKIRKIKKIIFRQNGANIRLITSREMLRLFGEKMSTDSKRILHLYADYQKSWKDKINLMLNCDICNECLENKWFFRLKILFNFI
ncbi:glycosyltransferase [Selenomonas sp. WCA-380-WT-3B 3/]|uniref:Glycosyltransferase n=1 Tax=Selenomonas montiformis TaxID=2652285 RepID=A0A6I2UZS9_9FIRM|nr:glycosyltransferase [Selenomonas montiformis]MSV25949.1 glycosyltransferase [Selenomonas montiformis]